MDVAVVVLVAQRNSIDDLRPLAPNILEALANAERGRVILVGGIVSHLPSGDRTGVNSLRLTGTRDPATRASSSDGPFSGRALRIS